MQTVTLNRDRWAWVVALVFIVLTLAALILVPLLVQRRVDQQRSQINDAEPARTLLRELQYNMVRELSSLNEYALSGDSEAVDRFTAARDAEQQIWEDLAPLAAKLGRDVNDRFVEARTIANLWHDQLNQSDVLRRERGAPLPASEVRRRFEEVLRATGKVDLAIVDETRRARDRIRSAQDSGVVLTVASAVLAVLAAATVATLVRRMRRLAIDAERGRSDAARALAETAQAVHARERLLRGITHDVKNPLGAARGYAELLTLGLKGPLNPEQLKLVAGVDRSIDGALDIISDLLDLARADSSGITVERVNTDLNNIVRQAVDDHRAAAQAAGHEIAGANVESSLRAYTDPARVRQVLDNLISNAIKYTPAPGRIVVRTDPDASDAPLDGQVAAIRVTDTGAGIPVEQRERIFDEFTRIDDGSDARGHGLGLAIARRIARLLGGELDVVDTEGPGSTFTLWLPQRDEEVTPAPIS